MKTGDKIEKIIRWVLYGYIMIFPWIFYHKNLTVSEDERAVWSANMTGTTDVFLYGKAMFTICIAFVLLACLLYKKICIEKIIFSTKKMKIDILTGCMLLFVCANILSFVFSKYKHIALWGNVNSCEGLLVILSYVILYFAAVEVFRTANDLTGLRYSVIFLSVVAIVLTFIEFLYMPLSQIISPDNWQSDYVNMVALTFYNADYFGGFTILIIPFIGYYWTRAIKVFDNIFMGILYLLLMFCNITSKSTASFYLMLLETIFLFMYYCALCIRTKRSKSSHYIKVFTVLGILLFCGLINQLTSNKITKVLSETSVNSTSSLHGNNYFETKHINVDHNQIAITGINNTLYITMGDNNALEFFDTDKRQMDVTMQDNTVRLAEPYGMIAAWIENNALTIDLGYKGNVRFYLYNGQFYPMLADGTLVKDISGNGLDNTSFIHFASGRGYIWLNSIPVLKNTLILGHGAGTYELYFKQFNFSGLLNSQGNVDLIVDKPHNLYLQIAEQSGLISAVAFILFLIILIVQSANILKVRKDTIGVAIIVALICFSLFEIISDSCVTVNALFWIIMGIQVGLNRDYSKSLSE